jgi:hypothetical protein
LVSGSLNHAFPRKVTNIFPERPQAFKVDEIRVHGSVYSQMSADTHVYVDRTGFVADIPDKVIWGMIDFDHISFLRALQFKEGELETLEVRFSAIRSLAVEKGSRLLCSLVRH